MEEQGDPSSTLAPYPNPPSYLWKDFAAEDIACQEPPPVPPNGRWRMFGQLHDLNGQLLSLEEQGVLRLGPPVPATAIDKGIHANKVFELKKLCKSLLLNFLELVGILGMAPKDAAEKLGDLQTIFYNLHQNINEWRPHQTREALISLLQSQLERTRDETRLLQETTDAARKTLISLDSIGKTAAGGEDNVCAADMNLLTSPTIVLEPHAGERARQAEIWRLLDSKFI